MKLSDLLKVVFEPFQIYVRNLDTADFETVCVGATVSNVPDYMLDSKVLSVGVNCKRLDIQIEPDW